MFPSTTIILYVGYTLCSVAGIIIIKSAFPDILAARSAGMIKWAPLIQLGIGAVLYVISFGLWMVILSRYPLSMAYPVAIGLTLGFSTLIAFLFLQETIGFAKLVGIGLIFFGIFLIFRG